MSMLCWFGAPESHEGGLLEIMKKVRNLLTLLSLCWWKTQLCSWTLTLFRSAPFFIFCNPETWFGGSRSLFLKWLYTKTTKTGWYSWLLMLKRLILQWPELWFCFLFLYTFSKILLKKCGNASVLTGVLLSIFWVWRQPFKSLMDKQKVFLSQTDPSSSVASVMELWWLVDAKFSSEQQCNVSPADVIFFQHFIFFFFYYYYSESTSLQNA